MSQRRLFLARIAWLVLFILALGVFASGIPAQTRVLQSACQVPEECISFQLFSEDITALNELGLSAGFYAGYAAVFTLFSMAAVFLTAAVIYLRKSDTWIGMLVSLALALSITRFYPNVTDALVRALPVMRLPVGFLQALGLGLLFLLWYVFPDGRFVPRWLRPVTLVIIVYSLVYFTFIFLSPALLPLGQGGRAELFVLSGLLGLLFFALVAQVYRYRHISGPVARQQTKWVIFGMAFFVLEQAAFILSPVLFPGLRRPGFPHLFYTWFGGTLSILFLLLWLFCLALSILRYRLWDVDLIIRRTLVYGGLTGTLSLVYFASVVLLERVIPFGSQASIVISTLLIAGLFAPLRRRIQRDIDRRFFRRKYNAEQVLQAFSQGLSAQVDLEQLGAGLVTVVQQAMEPETVSLWLKPHRLPEKAFKSLSAPRTLR